MSFTFRRFAPAALAACLVASPAAAQDAPDLVTAMEEFASRFQSQFSAESVESTGSNSVEANGLEVTGPKLRFTAREATVENYSFDELGLRMDEAEVTDIVGFLGGPRVEARRFWITDMLIRGADVTDVEAFLKTYSRIVIEDVALQMADRTNFTMDRLEYYLDAPDGNQVYTGGMTIDDLVIDVTSFPNSQQSQSFAALGYDKIEGRASFTYTFDVEAGEMITDDLRMEFEDMGAIEMTMKVGGYTPELIRQMSSLDAPINPTPEEQAQVMQQMIPVLGSLQLSELTYTLEDDSLTGRLMNLGASSFGMTPEQLAASAPAFIASGMQQFNLPDFTAQLSQAVGTFLAEQERITISLKPDAPASLIEIGLAMSTDPASAIKRFNLTVEAQ